MYRLTGSNVSEDLARAAAHLAVAPPRARRITRHARLGLEALDGRLLLTGGTIVPLPPLGGDYFLITGAPSQVTAGTKFTVTVTEYARSNGSEVTSDSGLTANLSISVGGIATQVGSVTLEGGSGKASVTLTKAEQVDALLATSGSLSNPNSYVSGGTGIIQVNPAAATQLVVTAPATATAGNGLNVTVMAEDQYVNVFNYNGSVTFKASDGQAVTSSGAVTNGKVTVTLNEPDSLTLTASAGSLKGTSGTVTVDAVAATSKIWSGYATTPGSGVTAVGATWVQPAISGPNGASNSIWVGIDGNGNGTVEQCGVAATMVNGSAQYVAWYEFFGDQSGSNKGPDYFQQNISGFAVHPGDNISAEVSVVPGTTRSFLFQMTDQPAGGGKTETFSLVQTLKYVTPQLATAEWIVENPNSGAQPLANFGHVTFTGAWATVNSVTSSINQLTNVEALNMVVSGTTFAVASNPPVIATSLGFNEPTSGQKSSSFTVTYQ